MNMIASSFELLQNRMQDVKSERRGNCDDIPSLLRLMNPISAYSAPIEDQELSVAAAGDIFSVYQKDFNDELLQPITDDIFDDEEVGLDEPLNLEPTPIKGETDALSGWLNTWIKAEESFSSESSDVLLNKKKRTMDEFFSSQVGDSHSIDETLSSKRQRCVVSDDECSDSDQSSGLLLSFQEGQWSEKFKELLEFKAKHGHCRVPHSFPENQSLARWVKRQRYQFKRKSLGDTSTMTDDRVETLNRIGFIWDSHSVAWQLRINELRKYREIHGHTNVPGSYAPSPQLVTWVKCQRRQYKLYMEGKPSNISPSRIEDLEKLGFEWTVRTAY